MWRQGLLRKKKRAPSRIATQKRKSQKPCPTLPFALNQSNACIRQQKQQAHTHGAGAGSVLPRSHPARDSVHTNASAHTRALMELGPGDENAGSVQASTGPRLPLLSGGMRTAGMGGTGTGPAETGRVRRIGPG